jgi:hypothetical protein
MKEFKLTKPEAEHILTLISNNENEGSYYAPKEQYWARSERIKKKLQEITKDTYWITNTSSFIDKA